VNVTVVVPRTLKKHFEGRRELELGIPPQAGVAELLETLFALYPKLSTAVASERIVGRQQLLLQLGERGARELALGRGGLRNGDRLYLSALPAEPGGTVAFPGPKSL
jgi:hypothetical protein